MVQRVWKANGLQTHWIKTFKVSNGPRFAEKLVDVVGLYLNPPEHAIVLCVERRARSRLRTAPRSACARHVLLSARAPGGEL